LHVKDRPQNGPQNGVLAARIAAVLMAAAVAILIAATESLTEIIVVVVLGYIITTIAVVRVLIGIRILGVRLPAILAVRLSGMKALLIPVVHGLAKHIGAVSIRLVVLAVPVVTIVGSCVKVWIAVVIVAIVLETHPLLALVVPILLLITGLCHAPFSLKFD